MSATETIRMTEASGIRLGVEGADLILDADREAAPRVLEAIRRHRAGIVALLTAADGDRTVEDWGASGSATAPASPSSMAVRLGPMR